MRIKKKLVTAEQFIAMISEDYQFDPKAEGYLGFINIDPQDEGEIAYRIAMNPSSFEKTANKYGLTIALAHESELIFEELPKK